jgi:trk system potassium uptake protein TrkA
MGAGTVGFHLAQTLSAEGHQVTVIERDAAKQVRISEELDVMVTRGNGADVGVLEAAGVGTSDLFMAVSSSDEANLTASLLARHLGAKRCVVRVKTSEQVISDRRVYEDLFGADLLLSTQLLTTTQILNSIRGHNTMAVEYLAGGKVQLRKVHVVADTPLTRHPLKDVQMPEGSLVVAYFRGDRLIVPSGEDKARAGDDALLLGKSDVIAKAERMVCSHVQPMGTTVIAGGGTTGLTVAKALESLDADVKIIEKDSSRAQELADLCPKFQILHGDATDDSLLKAERIEQAQNFVALTGNDESNLMACLLAQELGISKVIPVVHRAETSRLWRRLGLKKVFSPRALAHERIREYIQSDYSANIVSLRHGAAQVLERRIAEASPVAGASLAEMNPPRGLIVGAVVRGKTVFVPRGKDHLEAGDLVIIFVQQGEYDKVHLLFPGRDRGMTSKP